MLLSYADAHAASGGLGSSLSLSPPTVVLDLTQTQTQTQTQTPSLSQSPPAVVFDANQTQTQSIYDTSFEGTNEYLRSIFGGSSSGLSDGLNRYWQPTSERVKMFEVERGTFEWAEVCACTLFYVPVCLSVSMCVRV
jgi:hypothetical protein